MSYGNPTPPPPPNYGAPMPGAYGAPGGGESTSGKAITSLVTGILAVPTACCWPLALVLGVLGIVFGFLGRRDIEQSQGRLKGAGMALAGIICGAIGLLLAAVLAVLFLFGAIDTESFESN